MVDLGYDSYNSILNLGSISIVFVLYFVRLFILISIIIITRINKGKKGAQLK